MKRKIRRKSKTVGGVFVKALTKVDAHTRRSVLKRKDFGEWLTYSKRFHDSGKLAQAMSATVAMNDAHFAKPRHSRSRA
jgi:hypothetical protein